MASAGLRASSQLQKGLAELQQDPSLHSLLPTAKVYRVIKLRKRKILERKALLKQSKDSQACIYSPPSASVRPQQAKAPLLCRQNNHSIRFSW
jgi:hypothetical protein